MSFASRHSPRFNYATGNSPPLVGERNSFWAQRHAPPPSPSISRMSSSPPSSAMKKLIPDDKTLYTIIGVGIIVALLVDAATHSTKATTAAGSIVIGGRTYVPL